MRAPLYYPDRKQTLKKKNSREITLPLNKSYWLLVIGFAQVLLTMFRSSYQAGLLSILYSCGASPLELWDMQVKNGFIRRVTDEEVKSLALEIAGTNVATTYIYTPKNPKTVLGITLPFLIMIIKNMKKYFTFEITILDDKNMHRRFRISNFQSTTRVRPFCTTMPIGLNPGWNSIQFNVADFTRRAYGSNYVETTRMQIHANCRIRRIFFADKLYADDELPEEYKLLIPKSSGTCVRKKKEEKKPTKPSQAQLPVEPAPPGEPPVSRTGSKQLQEETERQTTPVESTEPSQIVIPEGASKVRIEVAEESGDEGEAIEHETEPESLVEGEYEAEEGEATMEYEDTAEETTGEEQQSPPPSPVGEEGQTDAEGVTEGEEQAELSENPI